MSGCVSASLFIDREEIQQDASHIRDTVVELLEELHTTLEGVYTI